MFVRSSLIQASCVLIPTGAQNTIGETEAIEVAWCTQPRNGARQLPLDKIYSAHFVKTPLYVQVRGIPSLSRPGTRVLHRLLMLTLGRLTTFRSCRSLATPTSLLSTFPRETTVASWTRTVLLVTVIPSAATSRPT